MNEKERKLNKEEAGKVTGGTAEETGPELAPNQNPVPVPVSGIVMCNKCGTIFDLADSTKCPRCNSTDWTSMI